MHRMVALEHGLARNVDRDGPSHDGLVRSRRSLVHSIVALETALVRAVLVLDHGGPVAEYLAAAVVGTFVGALSSVDASMTGKRRGLGTC